MEVPLVGSFGPSKTRSWMSINVEMLGTGRARGHFKFATLRIQSSLISAPYTSIELTSIPILSLLQDTKPGL